MTETQRVDREDGTGIERNAAYEAKLLTNNMRRALASYTMQPDTEPSPGDTEYPAVQFYSFFKYVGDQIVSEGLRVGGHTIVDSVSLNDYAEYFDAPEEQMWKGPVNDFINEKLQDVDADWADSLPSEINITGVHRVTEEMAAQIGIDYESDRTLYLPLVNGEVYDPVGMFDLDALADASMEAPEVEVQEQPSQVVAREDAGLDDYVEFETLEVTALPASWDGLSSQEIALLTKLEDPARRHEQVGDITAERADIDSYSGAAVTKALKKYLTDEERDRLNDLTQEARTEEKQAGEDVGETITEDTQEEASDLDAMHYQKLRSAALDVNQNLESFMDKQIAVDTLEEAGATVEDGEIILPDGTADEESDDDDEDEQIEEPITVDTVDPETLARAFVEISNGQDVNLTNAVSGAIQSQARQGDVDALTTIFQSMANVEDE